MTVTNRFILLVMLTQLGCSFCLEQHSEGYCVSPQYMEIGTTSAINCLFHQNFFAVLWYNTTDHTQNEPIIHYQNMIKKGTGSTLEDFDIHPNGSLIIQNVSLEHNRTFRVAYSRDRNRVPVYIDVDIVVIVKSPVPFPVLNYCGNESNKCYVEVEKTSVQCSVLNARPVVELTLATRTAAGDRNISNNMIVHKDGLGYTSRVKTRETWRQSLLLVLLVCKASSPPGTLQSSESFILAQHGRVDLSNRKPSRIFIERNNKMELNCSNTYPGFVVWKKSDSLDDGVFELLMYSVFMEEEFKEVYSGDVTLGTNGSLIIPVSEVQHEGLYLCIFGDGITDDIILHEVVILVRPVPPYPIIDGCPLQQHCVLESKYEGDLKCIVKGIRPPVQLQWKTLYDNDAALISFTSQELTNETKGDTFDVTLISTYRVINKSLDKVTVECKVISSQQALWDLRTEMNLTFLGEESPPPFKRSNLMGLWITLGLVIIIVVLGVSGVIYKKYCCGGASIGTDEEMTSMVEKRTLEKNTDIFLTQLKDTYKDLYEAVQPVGFRGNDNRFCVNNVFVACCIEVRESLGHWKRMSSYQDIYTVASGDSKRCIIEGECGYGKSTIALKFAYDWCNRKETSVMRDVEVLVLLKLGHLDGDESIYSAIQKNLLPKDSKLNKNDIENIIQLHESKRLLLILEGFDEYSEENENSSDICNIIKRKMFRDFAVVLTTRPSVLPNEYPATTKRVRLIGFDKNARREYILKAVVAGDEKALEVVESCLKKNIIVRSLGNVPLLFVLFAHMAYENEDIQNYESVTSFFRYIETCFKYHIQTKTQNKEKRNSSNGSSTKDYAQLRELAFDAISGRDKRLSWHGEQLSNQIGDPLYKQLVSAGILVETKTRNTNDKPGTSASQHVKHVTETRFCHSLFCEWYASRHLIKIIKKQSPTQVREILTNFDHHQLLNVYRFACGLQLECADKLIDFLKTTDFEEVMILCILEQTEDINKVKEKIVQMGKDGIVISGYDTILHRTTLIYLLEIAARQNITIDIVNLHNYLESVDISSEEIDIYSNVALTSKMTFRELQITLTDRDMTKDEAINVLNFSSKCESLLLLRFVRCVPPFAVEDKCILGALKSRGVTVKWKLFLKSLWYVLNLETGHWENIHGNSELTEEKFAEMRLEKEKDLKKTQDHSKKNLEYTESLRRQLDEKPQIVGQQVKEPSA